MGPRALPYQTYQLALTTGQVARIASDSQDLSGTPFDPSLLLTEGKYVQRDTNYWTPSGRVVFDIANFYLPIEAIDPFGAHSFVTYDNFSLLITSARDPLANVVSAVNDYRVLAPAELTDPNLNRSAVAFDALGMVIATAVMGKANRNEGDTLDNPTTWLVYDLLAFEDRGEPAFVHTFAREKHFSVDPAARIQETVTYSDGFGRVVLTKVQAEPARGTTTPRWVGTGRTVFNNKGNPVKQYEPYFSANSDFETEDAIVATGVTPILRYDSLDRLIRTDLPDGTFTKVEFDSWQQANWDQNDTVLDSQWYVDRGSPSATGPEPSAPAQRAAWLAAQHANTPTVSHLDTLGRPFLSDAHNRTDSLDDHYFTKTKLDIEGNTLAIFDARQIKANASTPLATIEQTFDVLQRRLKVVSADAGTRLMVPDVAGKPLRAWDSRGQTQRQRFDALQRPTHAYVRKGATERLLLRTVYGEALDAPGPPPTDPNFASPAQQANLRGKAHHVYDCAGLVTSIEHDFKGNLLSASRRLAVAYQTEPDWRPGATPTDPPAEDLTDPAAILTAVIARLQSETFTTSSTFDALNRVTSASAPDAVAPELRSVTRPQYNEANLLDAVFVSIRGATETPVITDLDYNARGQRTSCQYQNGAVTTYQYDPKTFRLTHLLTTHGGTNLQHLLYAYDPVGNITDVQDLSNWDSVLSALTAVGITGSGKYQYDALYRLVSATGREHPGPQPNGRTDTEPPRWPIPHGNDLQALQSYREELSYDAVGNILEMRHLRGSSNNASWSRRYDYVEENNRLRATSAPGDAVGTYSDQYRYDTNDGGLHGSMTRMPHLAALEWDYADRLKHTVKSDGSGQDTYFTYDASGQRVRKVYLHDGLIEERIYLGGYEVYRRHTSGSITATPDEERQTLHVMDDQRRVAMVETKTREAGAAMPTPDPRWRFQLDNHLGSATLELDANGDVISYEEYHPYGSTAFHTANAGAGVSAKRYRYTGKEKDDETELYYHGARYYAPWLGRWTAADPSGVIDGPNVYAYVVNNPIRLFDPDGRDWRDSLSWGQKAALWVDDKVKSSPVARGIVNNLEKRGEALVNAPGAIAEKLRQDGVGGLLKAVGEGAHHLVKDTGEALGDITYEATHYQGDKSKEKIASRSLDVVLNVADATTLVAGGVGAAKGGATAVASVGKTIEQGAAVLRAPALATAEGVVVAGTKATAAVATGAKQGASLAGPAGATVLMSTSGKGAGAKPKAAPKAPDAPSIPSVKGGEFAKWFNEISTSEFDKLWSNPELRNTIQSRMRAPGGMHEWLLVGRANIFKRWGVSAEQVSELRTAIDKVEFVNPAGKHGAKGSATAHNELLRLIDTSGNYAEFVQNLQSWASTRLKGGSSALPQGLRPR